MENQTLEEFAKQEAIKQYLEDTFGNLIVRKSIEKGAKWQAERMYSEEDMKEAFGVGINVGVSDAENLYYLTFEEWFEQFKNK